MEAKIPVRTLYNLQLNALVGRVADTLAQVKAKKPPDTLGDVKTKPLHHTFAGRQADVERAIFEDKMGIVEAEAIVYTLPHTLAEVKLPAVTNFLVDV